MQINRCSRCGEPYHRYSPEDPEHEADAVACINSLRWRIEDLEHEIARHHRDFNSISKKLDYWESNGHELSAVEAAIRNIVG